MKRIFKIALISAFALGATMMTSCNKEKEKEKEHIGVVINGVTWAQCNVAAPGKFAANSTDAGMFYQWNRKIGWDKDGNSYPSGKTWDNSSESAAFWAPENDPCPEGWRVPFDVELEKLVEVSKVDNMWVDSNGTKGRRFTDLATSKSIFLPQTSCLGKNGVYVENLEAGYYLSRSFGTNTMPISLLFTEENVGAIAERSGYAGYAVRCVKK